MPAEITEKILNISNAIAAKYSRPGTDKFEELVAIGNLAIVRSARRFSDDFGTMFSGFAFQAVEWAVRNALGLRRNGATHAGRWRSMGSIDVATGGGHETVAATIPSSHREDLYEHEEFVRHVLSKLPPAQGVVVSLSLEGFTCEEIGQRLGVSKGKVRALLEKGKGRLRVVLATTHGYATSMYAPRAKRVVTLNMRAAAHKVCVERHAKLYDSGYIPPGSRLFYLADDVERTVCGPYDAISHILAENGLPTKKGSGRVILGFAEATIKANLPHCRVVRGPEAAALGRDGGYRLVYRRRRVHRCKTKSPTLTGRFLDVT